MAEAGYPRDLHGTERKLPTTVFGVATALKRNPQVVAAKARRLRRSGKSGVATRNEVRSVSSGTDREFPAGSTATDGADRLPYRART